MQPGQFAGTCIYHVEFGWVMFAFFIVKCLTLFFRVYSEWKGILGGVLYLNPSLKGLNFQKKKTKQNKRGKKSQDSSQSKVDYFLNYPANWYVLWVKN